MKQDQYVVTIIGGTKGQADIRAHRSVPEGYHPVRLYSRREIQGDKTSSMVRTYWFEPNPHEMLSMLSDRWMIHD